jgi:hypothetical protein
MNPSKAWNAELEANAKMDPGHTGKILRFCRRSGFYVDCKGQWNKTNIT